MRLCIVLCCARSPLLEVLTQEFASETLHSNERIPSSRAKLDGSLPKRFRILSRIFYPSTDPLSYNLVGIVEIYCIRFLMGGHNKKSKVSHASYSKILRTQSLDCRVETFVQQ
ncbi:hypothetical protein CEXT_377171 [Caerostris extrusa]|uniref:Secreted protein n=1 Tax=Caerostris extrusa TaxID=172846 RepID=A0AAV4W1U9_CAEEX|nr:hypothetical protein CEXT_377171 [Caerostris extrusa]